jgi:hypothetical protein
MSPTSRELPAGGTDLSRTVVRVPNHIVFRSFVTETVVLNLNTGEYHKLDHRAGRIIEALEPGRTITDAAILLAQDSPRTLAELERECIDLCRGLARGGLVELGTVDA